MVEAEMTETVQVNGNGNGNFFAGWTPWMRFVAFIGPTATIAIGLTYFLTMSLTADVHAIGQRLEAHANVTSAASANLAGFVIDSKEETRALVLLLRQVCVNTATDSLQRRECLAR
jgi:hypothetical protein